MLGAVGYPLYSYVLLKQNMKWCDLGTDFIYSAALYTNNRFVSFFSTLELRVQLRDQY